MRIQCAVCEKAAASIMCCADEAALCADCDTRVHAANKLANKHQRISLIRTLADAPRCDICQEKSAFFFCLEDRALLCRDCDLSIHSATALSSAHQRFLVPGTKVALEALSNNPEAAPEQQVPVEEFVRHPLSSMMSAPALMSNNNSNNNYQQQQQQQQSVNTAAPTNSSNSSGVTSHGYAPNNNSRPAAAQVPAQSYSAPPPSKMTTSYPQKSMGMSPANSATHSSAGNGVGVGGGGVDPFGMSSSLTSRSSITDFLSDAIPNWRVDELLNIPDLADGYSLGDVASSKADISNLGDYDWTSDLSLFDEQFYADKFHEVPQLGSPPTVPSGVMGGYGRLGRGVQSAMKGKAKQGSLFPDYDDGEFLVPDLGLHAGPESPPVAKRRRQLLGNLAAR